MEPRQPDGVIDAELEFHFAEAVEALEKGGRPMRRRSRSSADSEIARVIQISSAASIS